MLVDGYPHEYPVDFFPIPNLSATHNGLQFKMSNLSPNRIRNGKFLLVEEGVWQVCG